MDVHGVGPGLPPPCLTMRAAGSNCQMGSFCELMGSRCLVTVYTDGTDFAPQNVHPPQYRYGERAKNTMQNPKFSRNPKVEIRISPNDQVQPQMEPNFRRPGAGAKKEHRTADGGGLCMVNLEAPEPFGMMAWAANTAPDYRITTKLGTDPCTPPRWQAVFQHQVVNMRLSGTDPVPPSPGK